MVELLGRLRRFSHAWKRLGISGLRICNGPIHRDRILDWPAWHSGGQSVGRASLTEAPTDFNEALANWTAVLGVATIALFVTTLVIGTSQWRDTRILQRAYLSVDALGVKDFKGRDETAAHIGIRNAGRLPATSVRWVIEHRLYGDDTLADFPVNEAEAIGGNVVSPRTTMRQVCKQWSTTSEEWQNRPRYLYVWGAVYYDDGFGRPSTTLFCHRYNTEMYESGVGIKKTSARSHYHANGIA